ncbi:MAG: hypothetical protein KC910_29940, partial [Candidatus Eremiobacteraeota bacterium]|nr:hypothetical protein [Candidatus Eremiobacteraeota bacterium]
DPGLRYLAELATCGVPRAAALEMVAEQTGQPVWRRAEGLGRALTTALADHEGRRLAEVCHHLAEWLSLERRLDAADRYWWGRRPRFLCLALATASLVRFCWQANQAFRYQESVPDVPWPILLAGLAWLAVTPLARFVNPTTPLANTARHFLAVRALIRCGLAPWQAARLAPLPGPDDPRAELLMEWGRVQGQSDRAAELVGNWAYAHHLSLVEEADRRDAIALSALAALVLSGPVAWAWGFWGVCGYYGGCIGNLG